MPQSLDYLEALTRLLHREKAADLQRYNQKMRHTSLLEKRQEGICWHPVTIVGHQFGLGGRIAIEIRRTTDLGLNHNFYSGNVITIFASQDEQMSHQINGVISKVTKNDMIVALNADRIPDWFREQTLGVFLAFDESTYREMFHALGKVIEAPAHTRLGELRELLLGKQKPRFRDNVRPHELHQDILDPLNPTQQAALRHVIAAQDIALIHGPPGTGKTTTLVAAVAQTLRYQRQVLVCAPSNTAVDLIAEKLDQQGISVVRLGHPARVEEHLEALTLDAQFAQSPDYKAYKQLLKTADQLREQAQKFKRQFGHRQRQERKDQLSEARAYKEEARQLEDYIVHQILETAQVIACTLTGTGHKYLRHRFFDTVFVDEAAQALEPAAWIPLQRAQRVIMAGDHEQLPPTIKSESAAKAGLAVTLFEQCIQKHPQSAQMLTVQYRMHRDIMSFSSAKFYQNALVAHPSNAQHTLLPDEAPLEFWDTAGADMTEILDEESLSRYNPEEGYFIIRHLIALFEKIKQSPLSGEELLPLRIGLIVPYRAQQRWLDEAVKATPELESYLSHIVVRTVDGFQGQECDVVYISLVRSNNKGEIGFLSNFRRLNVALTRAKKKLIVVGDTATLCQHDFFADFISYIEQKEAYRSVWEWV